MAKKLKNGKTTPDKPSNPASIYNTPAGIKAARENIRGDYNILILALRTTTNSVKAQIRAIDNFFDKYERYAGEVDNINMLAEKAYIHPLHCFWIKSANKPRRPLTAARVSVVKHLLARGVSPNLAPDSDMIDPLGEALASQDYTVAKLFLQKGANPNAVHGDGRITSLMHAAFHRDRKMLRFLLKHDADPNYLAGWGKNFATQEVFQYTPLCYLHEATSGPGEPISLFYEAPPVKSFRRDVAAIVKILCAAGADINLKAGEENKSLKQLIARADDGKYHAEWNVLIKEIEKEQTQTMKIGPVR